MTAIIEVSHLVKEFGEHRAVDDVSFVVEKGEVFGLLGPNGAGKSTTIKMLTTLLTITGGHALVNGFDVERQTTAVRHSIGYVPQALSADGNLTGFENLLIFAKLYDLPRNARKARVSEVLDYVGLTDASAQLVRTYSGGMIRRLEVAQSLLHQPQVLFLDEPTVGLDPVARQAIWDHLLQLKNESNMTIFLTTHSMEEADSLCTRIGIMHRGVIAAIGTSDELKATVEGDHPTLNDVFVHYAGDALNLEEATVKLQERDEPRAGSASSASIALPSAYRSGPFTFVRKAWVIAEWEARKIRHDWTDLVTRAVQPLLWLLVFGETFTRIHAIPTGNVSYLSYLAPGILAQSVLFISIFAGIAIIWERDLGVIHKFLASPTPRVSLVVGKGLASGIRALPQAIVIYIVSILLGASVQTNPLCILGVLVMAVLGAACFSTFSLIIACLLKTRDRVMGIGQVLTMPLFFASNAIYPISIMPDWLRVIANVNPLTYVVGALRTLMLTTTTDYSSLYLDFGVLLVVTIVLVAIGAALYPRIVQ